VRPLWSRRRAAEYFKYLPKELQAQWLAGGSDEDLLTGAPHQDAVAHEHRLRQEDAEGA